MIRVRRSGERGHFDHGWLQTYHSFSFASYYDPEQMGFRSLRVINEDWVQPGEGFGMHHHRDMEIVTYVMSGALTHRDSLGNGGLIGAGEMQRITAGTGILHSEFNDSPDQPVHLYQIWLQPERRGLTPGYEQRRFEGATGPGAWRLVASRDGREGSMLIHQDASLSLAVLGAGQEIEYPLAGGRHAWVQVARGRVELNGQSLAEGDGAAVSGEPLLRTTAEGPAEVILFDLG